MSKLKELQKLGKYTYEQTLGIARYSYVNT